jgi:hypothetical protein
MLQGRACVVAVAAAAAVEPLQHRQVLLHQTLQLLLLQLHQDEAAGVHAVFGLVLCCEGLLVLRELHLQQQLLLPQFPVHHL